MTFVTDVQGAILKSYVNIDVSVTVSGTTPYSYSYPTTEEVTLTGREIINIPYLNDGPGIGIPVGPSDGTITLGGLSAGS